MMASDSGGAGVFEQGTSIKLNVQGKIKELFLYKVDT